ncbi:uncharacterized protein LOC110825481 [Carica papaya]|uniref:uncharacterized protein LOC110825481 n=1 Tax=Carica papaya TaxID=3649 RepID=UPI000B8CFC14|nr:uncharacterized protein LOC110825481 [Carica papaya]
MVSPLGSNGRLGCKEESTTRKNCRLYMDKSRFGFLLLVCVIISLGLVSFISCFVAEVKKAKRKDLKWDGRLCYLPGSEAYGLGFAALLCFSIAQIIGTLVIGINICCSTDKINHFKARIPAVATALLVFSWSSFGIGVILVSTATSMSKTQSYGKGGWRGNATWSKMECLWDQVFWF